MRLFWATSSSVVVLLVCAGLVQVESLGGEGIGRQQRQLQRRQQQRQEDDGLDYSSEVTSSHDITGLLQKQAVEQQQQASLSRTTLHRRNNNNNRVSKVMTPRRAAVAVTVDQEGDIISEEETPQGRDEVQDEGFDDQEDQEEDQEFEIGGEENEVEIEAENEVEIEAKDDQVEEQEDEEEEKEEVVAEEEEEEEEEDSISTDRLYLYGDRVKTVMEYTGTLNDFQKSTNPRIVEFYSPYCGACKAFMPKYIELSQEVSKIQPNVEFYSVSCMKHKLLCNEYNIDAYPTMLAFGDSANKIWNKGYQKVKREGAAYTSQSILDSLKDVDGKSGTSSKQQQQQQEGGQLPFKKKKKPLFSSTGTNTAEDERTTTTTTGTRTRRGDNYGTQQQQQQQQGQLPQLSQQEMSYNGNGPMVGVRKVHGAQRKETEPVSMDRFKEVMARERQRKISQSSGLWNKNNEQKGVDKIIGKQIKQNPQRALNPEKDTLDKGATKNMEAFTPGTREFQDRRARMQKQMAKWNKNMDRNGRGGAQGQQQQLRQNNDASTANNPTIFKKENLPFRKEIKKQTIAEKIPVVKRFKKLSYEEGLYLDVSSAFFTGMQYGVHNSVDPLSGQRKKALLDWLNLLSVSIPQEWALQELIGDLHSNLDLVSTSQANMLRILDKHKLPRKGWSDECGKSYNGLSCATWRLMHMVTVGVAEHQGGTNLIEAGIVDDDTPTFTPMSAAGVVRGYIANFFGCKDCRDHFLSQYDDCSFRRCIRLADKDDDDIDADDWKELALWLWEVHNDVSVRVANEKVQRNAHYGHDNKLPTLLMERKAMKKTAVETPHVIQSLWPSLDQCLVCFKDDGSWKEDAVFAYIEKSYWTMSDDLYKDRLLQLKPGAQTSHFGFLFYMMMAALALVYTTRKQIIKSAPHALHVNPSWFFRRAVSTIAPTPKRSV